MSNSKNTFTSGGAVQAGTGFYILRQADQELLSLCRKGICAHVFSARQTGKSSLIFSTMTHLEKEDIKTVFVDISPFGYKGISTDQWYLVLLSQISEHFEINTNLNEWWRKRSDINYRERTISFFKDVLLKEVADQIVIFIDEVDSSINIPSAKDFFVSIRAMRNARSLVKEYRRLSFVLTGVGHPHNIVKNPKRTPFNIGGTIALTDFTFAEAMPLAHGFNLPLEMSQDVLGWVLKWTGGHPYLTMRLCKIVAGNKYQSLTEAEVDKLVESTFLSEDVIKDNNIQYVRDMLLHRTELDIAEVLEMFRRILRGGKVIDEQASLIKAHLKLSGIAKPDNGFLVVRNKIYRNAFNEQWIEDHLPVEWKRFSLAKRLFRDV